MDCNKKRVKFGTDGIRGEANKELTADISLLVGRYTAHYMSKIKNKSAGKILIGKDTRLSSDMIEAALIAGITSAGVNACRVGIIPTPGLAFLTNEMNCDCGIMISASHNPVEDNGIKIFSGEGFKLEDEDERAIEDLINNESHDLYTPSGDEVGGFTDKSAATGSYINNVKRLLRGVFFEGKVVFDCANGAASKYAKRIFKDCAEEVIFINADEDGHRINVDCGSTRPDKLAKRILKNDALFGVAFDGDADRVIFVSEKGDVIDGDQLMLLAARHLKEEGRLPGSTVVSTVMSNMGFEHALKEIGVNMLRTQVGDKFVLRQMKKGGYNLGGEQSGHIIFLDITNTGDGLLTAAQILKYASKDKRPISEQTQMQRSAQFLKNIRVPDKDAFYGSKAINDKISDVEKKLGDDGRVVVRPSGTEPVIRVMVETWDREQAEMLTDEILSTVRTELKVD